MQLKEALRSAGYTVVQFYERLSRSLIIDYKTTARYCRCCNRKTLDPIVWEKIEECLTEMGVEWKEYNGYIG